MSFDKLDRITDRSRARQIERASAADRIPRAVERAMGRSDGPATPAPPDVQFLARQASGSGPANGEDMRSAMIRRMVAMQVLDAMKGLARADEGGGGGDGDGGGDGGGGGGGESGVAAEAASVFDSWFAEMQGQGLNKAEIEEHLVARLRALRRSHFGSHEERRLRRK